MKNILLILFFAGLLLINSSTLQAQAVSDYLILQNIGPYKVEAPASESDGHVRGPRTFEGGNFGLTGHFFVDHSDKTYEIYYAGKIARAFVAVQVTQHMKSDADKWLLHELDLPFRSYYGLPADVEQIIDGNTIYACHSGGGHYRWLSGDKVILVDYYDTQLLRPEPTEVIKAYLAKHPSTIRTAASQELKNNMAIIAWIKDEMERRLWLYGQWLKQVQAGNRSVTEALSAISKCAAVFLDYRERYYKDAMPKEKEIVSAYVSTGDIGAMEGRLTEYKAWWKLHKDDPIKLSEEPDTVVFLPFTPVEKGIEITEFIPRPVVSDPREHGNVIFTMSLWNPFRTK